MKHGNESNIPSEVISYAAGFCEAKIAEIARDSSQPEQELREWVAVLFLTKGTGISNNLSTLRGKTSKVYSPARKMALVNNTHPESQTEPSNPPRKVSSKKGFKYNGTHWTQQPKNRKRVAAIAKARAAKQAAKVA